MGKNKGGYLHKKNGEKGLKIAPSVKICQIDI